MLRNFPRRSLLIAATLLLWSTVPTPVRAAEYDVGVKPSSVAVGDFNGDGWDDLVVANLYSDNVSVLLNNRDGTFAAARNYPVGSCSQPPNQHSFPTSVAVKDFNGDGWPDLVVANSGCSTVSVLLNRGALEPGTFFQRDPDYFAGFMPSSVAVGDFNGDRVWDLAVANGTESDLTSGVSTSSGGILTYNYHLPVVNTSSSLATGATNIEISDIGAVVRPACSADRPSTDCRKMVNGRNSPNMPNAMDMTT